jgi:hypothetical protein
MDNDKCRPVIGRERKCMRRSGGGVLTTRSAPSTFDPHRICPGIERGTVAVEKRQKRADNSRSFHVQWAQFDFVNPNLFLLGAASILQHLRER